MNTIQPESQDNPSNMRHAGLTREQNVKKAQVRSWTGNYATRGSAAKTDLPNISPDEILSPGPNVESVNSYIEGLQPPNFDGILSPQQLLDSCPEDTRDIIKNVGSKAISTIVNTKQFWPESPGAHDHGYYVIHNRKGIEDGPEDGISSTNGGMDLIELPVLKVMYNKGFITGESTGSVSKSSLPTTQKFVETALSREESTGAEHELTRAVISYSSGNDAPNSLKEERFLTEYGRATTKQPEQKYTVVQIQYFCPPLHAAEGVDRDGYDSRTGSHSYLRTMNVYFKDEDFKPYLDMLQKNLSQSPQLTNALVAQLVDPERTVTLKSKMYDGTEGRQISGLEVPQFPKGFIQPVFPQLTIAEYYETSYMTYGRYNAIEAIIPIDNDNGIYYLKDLTGRSVSRRICYPAPAEGIEQKPLIFYHRDFRSREFYPTPGTNADFSTRQDNPWAVVRNIQTGIDYILTSLSVNGRNEYHYVQSKGQNEDKTPIYGDTYYDSATLELKKGIIKGKYW